MKRAITFIIFAVAFCNFTFAISVDEQLEKHRQWCKTHIPSPEGMTDKQLLNAVADMFDQNINDSEACAIIRAAGKWDGIFVKYADILESKSVDVDLGIEIHAKKRLFQIADSLFETDKYLWSRCGYILADEYNRNLQEDVACNIIEELISVLSKEKDEKYIGMLYLCKAFRVALLVTSNREYPEIWDEIANLEKESWRIAKKSTINDWYKSEIHSNLAFAISCNSNFVDFRNVFLSKIDSRTNMYDSNIEVLKQISMKHLNEAKCLLDRTYHEHHPQLYKYIINEANVDYSLSDVNSIKELLPNLETVVSYFRNYYSTDSYEYIDARINYLNLRLLCHEHTSVGFYISSLISSVNSLCTKNYKLKRYFLNCLLNTSISARDTELVGHTLKSIDNIKIEEDPYSQLLSKNQLYSYYSFYEQNQDRQKEFFNEISNIYLSNHKAEWKWINLGYTMFQYLCNIGVEQSLTKKVEDSLLGDYFELIGEKDRFYVQILALFASTYAAIDKDGMKLFDDIINISKRNNQDVDLAHLGKAKLLENMSNYDDAINEYKEAITYSNNKEAVAIFNVSIANLLVKSNKKEEAIRYYEKAEPVIMTNAVDINNMFSAAYQNIAEYYGIIGQNEKAESLYQKIYEQYIEYRAINNNFINLVTSYKDFLITCKRDLTSALDVIDKATLLFDDGQTSFPLLNLYFDKIDILANIAPGDYNRFMPVYSNVMLMAQKLMTSVNAPDEFGWLNIMGRVCSAADFWFLNPYLQNKQYIANQKNMGQEIPDTYLSVFEAQKAMIAQQLSGVDQWETAINNMDDNFKKIAAYYQVLNTCALIKEAQSDNTDAAEALFKKSISDAEEYLPYLKDATTIRYVQFLMRNNKEELSTYVSKIEEISKSENIGYISIKPTLYSMLSLYYISNKEWDKASAYALKYKNAVREYIDNNLGTMSSSERQSFLNVNGTGGIFLESILPYNKELSSEVYNSILYEKGILLRAESNTRSAIVQSKDTTLISMMSEISILKEYFRQYNQQFSTDLAQNAPVFKDMQEKYERLTALEHELANRTGNQKDAFKEDTYQWTDVQQSLCPDEAAIEFIPCQNVLYALIVRKDSRSPECIELVNMNDSTTFTSFVDFTNTSEMRANAGKLYGEDVMQLYNHLWKPLETHLNGINKCFISLSDYWSRLNFQAFKLEGLDKILNDTIDIRMVTSTTVLPKYRKVKKIQKQDYKNNEFTIYGGIYYNEQQQNESSNSKRHRGAVNDTEPFPYLNGTYRELQDIDSIFESNGVRASNIKCYSGLNATEKSFSHISDHSPNILHIGTHGFYVNGVDEINNNAYLKKYPNSKYDPMLRTGLVFAMAEPAWTGTKESQKSDDGIVTSYEIGEMNLQNVDLVVLSACESALGDSQRDGISGLQKGFKQAGVKSILATLWSVDDEATCEFMKEFYKNLLLTNSKQKAMKISINKMREKYADPYYWAPFILLDAIE